MIPRFMCSAMRGRLMRGGQALVGEELVRTVQWLGEDQWETRCRTDAEGRFEFPALSLRRLREPKDVLILQEILIRVNEQQWPLWAHTRQSTEDLAESCGVPIVVTFDLAQEPRELKIPRASEGISLITIRGELEHPYLRALERAKVGLTPELLRGAIARLIQSPSSRMRLRTYLPKLGEDELELEGLGEIQGLETSDLHLLREARAGALADHGSAKFLGMTLRAKVPLRLRGKSSAELIAGFFCSSFFLPLSEALVPGEEAAAAERWELDLRAELSRRVREKIDRAALEDCALELLQREPPSAWVMPAIEVKEREEGCVRSLKIEDYEVGVHLERANLKARGTLSLEIQGKSYEPAFRAQFEIALHAMDRRPLRARPKPDTSHIVIQALRAHLTLNKSKYSLNEAIEVGFRLENRLPYPVSFLIWHSPFEGFRNDFFDLQSASGEREVPYQGCLASRARPGPESYRTIPALGSMSSSVELTEAYPIREPGFYTLRYKGLGDSVSGDAVSFTVE